MNGAIHIMSFAALEGPRSYVHRAADRSSLANDRSARHRAVCKALPPPGRPGMR
jgi:hypothetical protein